MKTNYNLKYIFIFLIISINIFSYTEKNISIFSKSMNKNIPITLVLPDKYSNNKQYPTIYLLHGLSGTNRAFSDETSIGKLSDKYNIIYVAPDGNSNSWYVDSETNKNSRYSTFISKELVGYIDENYSTYKNRTKRAITGFSMGGFGALYNGIKNHNVFGNIGSMSGGVSPEKIKKGYDIKQVINSNWRNYNIKDIIGLLKNTGYETNIIIDCGTSDSFIEMNRELHRKLLSLDIKHDYIERIGNHNWDYWRNSIEYQTFFFNNNFNK